MVQTVTTAITVKSVQGEPSTGRGRRESGINMAKSLGMARQRIIAVPQVSQR